MTAWQGLYDNVYGVTHALQVDISPLRRKLTRVVRRKGMGNIRELMRELNGATAGDAALVNHVRVQAQQVLLNNAGGVRPIETKVMLNRVTAAADIVMIEAMLTEDRKPTYPTDASGNGGGGKVGF